MNQKFGSRQGRAFPLVLFLALVAIVFLLSIFAPSLDAAIVSTGNISPALPWGSSTTGIIGYTGNGSLLVDAGSQLASSYAYIAYNTGATGTATVTGTGSKWTNDFDLNVGYFGSGMLTIEAGGQVRNGYGYLGFYSGTTGMATVTGNGSTWINSYGLYVGNYGSGSLTVTDGGTVTTKTLYASLENLHGNGTITATEGAVLDADLRFDAAHGTQGTIAFGSGGTLTVNASGGNLGAGYKGSGSLTVAEGVTVASFYGYLGYHSGSTGTATVTGAGSTWANSGNLFVGYEGSGALTVTDGGTVTTKTLYASLENLHGNGTITATEGAVLDADLRFDAAHGNQQTFVFGSGGTLTVNASGGNLGAGYKGNGSLTVAEGVTVSSSSGYLGYSSGSMGTATVTGAGSKWANSGSLSVGGSGSGMLTIEAGGQVSNAMCYLGFHAGSTGTATVTGAGSAWANSSLHVGYLGSGTLIIAAGGQVNNGSSYLGYSSSSTGTATVTGTGSTWINSSGLFIGYYGSGSLTVTDGGTVTATTLYASLENLHGNGTITATGGAVLDAELRFDAAHGTQRTFAFGSGGTLTVNASGGNLGAGYKGSGSLIVAEGVTVTSSSGLLGYHPGSTGTATVTGAGSKWTNSSSLYVGYSGSGTLTIEAGGQVSNSSGYLGFNSGTTGTATVTGAGSTWTNSGDLVVVSSGSGSLTVTDGGMVTAKTLWASLKDLYGNGTITTEGAVLDADVRFDAAHGNQGIIVFGSGGTLTVKANGGDLGAGYKESGSLTVAEGVTVASSYGYLGYNSGSTGTATVTGAGSKWTNISGLYVGRSGRGTLMIEAGGQVSNTSGYLGVNSGSTGTATVTGGGSKWTNSGNLYVGRSGSGALTIEAGGQVSNAMGYLGFHPRFTGTATVTGVGSKWTNSGDLRVGSSGSGILHIRDGGKVTASSVTIYNSSSLLTLDVGSGSLLSVGGTGTFTNSGIVRILADPSLTAASQFSPIIAATWSGSGTYQAVGGTWNTMSHVFTVSSTLAGVSGTPVNIDLAQQQRVLVEDSQSGWKVGASFLAKTGTGNSFDFAANALAGADLSSLQLLLPPGQSVLSGWNLNGSGTGYVASDPVYLSLGVPTGLSRSGLHLWRFSGGAWSTFAADDLTSASDYASFTSTGLSGYAVAALLPAGAWNADADGVWQAGANWTTGPNAPGGVNTAAVLGTAITAPRTVTLSAPLTLGLLTFDSAQHYTMAGDEALTLQVNPGYSARIDVPRSDAGGHVIATPVMLCSPLEISIAPAAFLTLAEQVQNPGGQTLTLSGGGTLTVTEDIVTTGTLNVQAGTLITTSLTAGTLNIGSSASGAAAVPEPSMWVLLLACVVGGYVVMSGSVGNRGSAD